jgi:hypothetical protein
MLVLVCMAAFSALFVGACILDLNVSRSIWCVGIMGLLSAALILFLPEIKRIGAYSGPLQITARNCLLTPTPDQIVYLARAKGGWLVSSVKGGAMKADGLPREMLFSQAAQTDEGQADGSDSIYVWTLDYEIHAIESDRGAWHVREGEFKQGLHLCEIKADEIPCFFSNKEFE